MERVDTASFRRRIVHPRVVNVGEQDCEPRHELAAVGGSCRQEPAIGDTTEPEDAGRDVTRVHDPVIGEERRVPVWRRCQGLVGRDRLEGRDLLYGLPEWSSRIVRTSSGM